MSRIIMAAALSSCSIKEDRTECPCHLDIALMRQAEQTFAGNKAWYGVWNGEQNICNGLFSPVTGKDSSVSHPFPRNQAASVVISNIEQDGGRISVEPGSQMVTLYISRKDVDCEGDVARVEFDSFCKQYVDMTFLLDEDAYPFRDSLLVAVDSPYDGISLPSLKPHAGAFRSLAAFDREGKAQVRIPPQGGPGAKAEVQFRDNLHATTTIDLYWMMLEAGFDWGGSSLTDFVFTLGLNTVSGIIRIVDWNVIQLEDIKFPAYE